ncbi:pilus assembly protein TadG-related protein [Rothia sp. P6271]|uniref:pilus assembly protein TadG-related protein n=1 Tax=Rothia sp. P6271 TaxID=3402659 RepID=UPI003AD302D5
MIRKPQDAISFSTPAHKEQEQGSIMLLLIGLCLVLLLIASVTAGISAVYVEHKKLQVLADRTSSAAAQEIRALHRGGVKPRVLLNDASVQESAQNFLRESSAYTQFEALILSSPTGASTPETALVTLRTRVKLPLMSVVVPEGVEISATSSARSRLEQ